MQEETYNHAVMQEELKLLQNPESDSDFDYQELFKKPQQPKLLKYTNGDQV